MTGVSGWRALMIAVVMALGLGPACAFGQEEKTARPADAATGERKPEDRPASELVHEGNRRYHEGDVTAALELYRRALPAIPDSHELAFNLGLTHLKLGDLAAAREEFNKALQTRNPRLANDALYALGVCDHAEALGQGAQQQPSKGLELTQDAIRRYHDVLRADPNHAGARDAWNKAAALWQRLKAEQPPPQSGQGQDNKEESDNEPSEEQNPSSSEPSPSEQPSQGEPREQPREQSQEQSGDAQPADPSQPRAENPPPNADPRNPPEKQSPETEATPNNSEKETEDSLEQAARELRRIMDRQRINEKRRPQPAVKPSAPPAGKDW